MRIADLVIIYLACGAPVGVHHFTQSESKDRYTRAVFCLAAVLLWPLFVLLLLIGQRRPDRSEQESSFTGDRSLKVIEQAAFRETETQALFDFREIFNRYEGIARSSLGPSTPDGFRAFYAISDHPSPSTASKCRNRTNQNKIAQHLSSVRLEFIQAVSHLCGSASDPANIARIAIEVADRLDSATGSDLVRSSLRSFLSASDRVSDGIRTPKPETSASGLRKAA